MALLISRRIIGPMGAGAASPAATVSAGTTVFSNALADAPAGLANFTIVQFFPASLLDPATGNQARLTLKFSLLNSGVHVVSYFGKSNTGTGDDYDFIAGQAVHVTFSAGGDIVGNGVTTTFVSDWVNLPSAYDEAAAYCFAFQIEGGVGNGDVAGATSGVNGGFAYSKGSGAAEASLDNKTGYSGFAADAVYLCSKIEIR